MRYLPCHFLCTLKCIGQKKKKKDMTFSFWLKFRQRLKVTSRTKYNELENEFRYCYLINIISSSYSFRRLLQKHQQLKNQFQLTVSTSHPMYNNHQKTKKLISWGNLKSSAKVHGQFVKNAS